MKSFKEFLLSLDDSVDETEAVKRYNEYKIDFRRQQMQDFFLAHKDEEWYDHIWFILMFFNISSSRLYRSFPLVLIVLEIDLLYWAQTGKFLVLTLRY